MVKKLVKAASYLPEKREKQRQVCDSEEELKYQLNEAKQEIKTVFEKANYFKEKLSRCNEESELPDEFIPGDDGEEDSKYNSYDDDEEIPASDEDLQLPGNDYPVSNDMNEEEILDNGSSNRQSSEIGR